MLWKMAPKLALLFREGRSTALLAAMQEGVARLPGNMANAIYESF